MSAYADRISVLNKKRLELAKRHKDLIDQRKRQILSYLEKFDLLDAPDEVLCGMFEKLKKSLKSNDDSIKEFASHGAKFLKSRTQKTKKANSATS